MQIKNAAKVFGGACVVYLAMAACGASDHVATGKDAGASSASSAGGGSIFDALTDPVSEAKAGSPPDVATEKCDKFGTNSAGTTFYYAEHSYPGKTSAELLLVAVGLSFTNAALPDYEMQQGTPWIKDGYVALLCGQNTQVTFVLPSP